MRIVEIWALIAMKSEWFGKNGHSIPLFPLILELIDGVYGMATKRGLILRILSALIVLLCRSESAMQYSDTCV